MKADIKFKGLNPEFWAVVKLLSQRLGYTIRKTKSNPNGGFIIPTSEDIVSVFKKEELEFDHLVLEDFKLTQYGQLIVDYFNYRRDVLQNNVESNLMNASEARNLYNSYKNKRSFNCPLPYNKQKGDKYDKAFLTCLVNMLIEDNIEGNKCDYDPREITSISIDGYLKRIFSRRVDGAYPSVKNPIALWEIKEYYYTTTFGSRIADGVYETQLDGWELYEANLNLDTEVNHLLIVDAYDTWWNKGKSYLCRLIDILHMGLVDEVIFGKEVIKRIPILVKEWIS